jgi:hypothetical protein
MLRSFKTKKDKHAFVKNIIYKNGCGYIKDDHEYFELFKELVENKNYSNIFYFSIVPNRINTKTYECQVHLEDGSIKVFSWTKCVLNRVETSHHKLRNIMRSAIVSDILSFKNNAICCNYCGNVEYLHADHIEPFRDLADNFISEHGMGSAPSDGVRSNATEEWVNAWKIYHKQNASLQILCASCNYKKH